MLKFKIIIIIFCSFFLVLREIFWSHPPRASGWFWINTTHSHVPLAFDEETSTWRTPPHNTKEVTSVMDHVGITVGLDTWSTTRQPTWKVVQWFDYRTTKIKSESESQIQLGLPPLHSNIVLYTSWCRLFLKYILFKNILK